MQDLEAGGGGLDSLVAMGEVGQVLHGDKGVVEGLGGGYPLLRVDPQHLLQQAHKLPAVSLLGQQVAPLQIHHQVHLPQGWWLRSLCLQRSFVGKIQFCDINCGIHAILISIDVRKCAF